MQAVQLLQKVELIALSFLCQVCWPNEIVDRLTFRLEISSLVNAGKISGAPVRRVAFRKTSPFRVAHHDVAGQVLALASQAVRHPRSDAGETHSGHATVHRVQGRGVVVRFGEAGMDERHFVDVLTEVRKDLRDKFAALAARSELERRLHQVAD